VKPISGSSPHRLRAIGERISATARPTSSSRRTPVVRSSAALAPITRPPLSVTKTGSGQSSIQARSAVPVVVIGRLSQRHEDIEQSRFAGRASGPVSA
jgi:hypothetical protein